MPNQISGQYYNLQWSDFAGSVPANRKKDQAAFTSATFDANFQVMSPLAAIGFKVPAGQNGGGFVAGNVVISVSARRQVMWAVQAHQTPALLAHEQGHYDIVGLIMADLYTDLLSPPSEFSTQRDALNWANGLLTAAGALISKLQSDATKDGFYDSNTVHGTDATEQGKWNRAFALSRPPTGMRFNLALDAVGIAVP